MRHNESRLQCACKRWFDYQYPHLKKLLVAIPNGGARSRFEAAIMQGEGVTAGMPDMILFVPSAKTHALLIEMKSATGKLTDNQRQQIAALKLAGYETIICNSKEKFIHDVTQHINTAIIDGIYPARNIAAD